jgi:hypothetical protein
MMGKGRAAHAHLLKHCLGHKGIDKEENQKHHLHTAVRNVLNIFTHFKDYEDTQQHDWQHETSYTFSSVTTSSSTYNNPGSLNEDIESAPGAMATANANLLM